MLIFQPNKFLFINADNRSCSSVALATLNFHIYEKSKIEILSFLMRGYNGISKNEEADESIVVRVANSEAFLLLNSSQKMYYTICKSIATFLVTLFQWRACLL